MNKQNRESASNIEWTEFTSNPIGGCLHGCQWRMPTGEIANCYAEDIAEGVARNAYPQGFEHHYWRPNEINEWQKVKTPAKVFVNSMSDLFGSWVPKEQVELVLGAMGRAHWHTFQSLTKATPNMLKYNALLPGNLWAGASVPPTFFKGHQLTEAQQARMLHRTMEVLSEIKTPVRWLSIEPLSWDISGILESYPGAIRWAVIGAASNGKRKYQPKHEWVQNVLDVLDAQGVAVFFKGNLQWDVWREEFPVMEPKAVQMGLFES